MQNTPTIKAIEEHAERFNLEVSTIGQLSVKNRHAYDRIKKGTAHCNTVRDVMAWIEQDRSDRAAQ
jgi:hypothetical protein